MNSGVITGYISTDVELRKIEKDNLSVTRFTVAVKRPRVKDVTDFIPVVCWRELADFVSTYFQKGSGIEVSGVMTMRNWEDKNGNKRVSFELIADNVDFGKSSKVDRKEEKTTPPESSEVDTNNVPAFDGDEDGLPF